MNPEAGIVVQSLGSALLSGQSQLSNVPGLLKRLLREGMWREFVTPMRQTVTYDRFEDFVVTPPTKGLGASVDLIRRIVKDDAEALDMLDVALQRPHGGDTRSDSAQTNVDNINVGRPAGTSKEHALRKLRTSAPELHADVLQGRLSAHAAMVQAGYRKRTASVPLNPTDAAATLRRLFTDEQWQEFAELVAKA
jgi:hypothetical protein